MTTEPEPLTMRIGCPEDLLALVPVLLGFEPDESVTMLSVVGGRPFHARLDLPDPEHVDEALEGLCRAVRHHRITSIALVAHSRAPAPAADFARVLLAALADLGVESMVAVVADGSRWATLDRAETLAVDGTPYDVSAHPFVVQSILRGEVVHRSREDLARSLDADPAAVARVEEARATLAVPAAGRTVRWAVGVVRQRVQTGADVTDADVALLHAVLDDPRTRDALIELIDRGTAARHARFWTTVLQRSAEPSRDRVAVMLALAAWLSGHGALAWCALDQVTEDGARQGLAVAVRTALERAVPPDLWWRGQEDDLA